MNNDSNDSYEFSDEYIANALDTLKRDLEALDEDRKRIKRAIRGVEAHIKAQRIATQRLEEQWATPAFEVKA